MRDDLIGFDPESLYDDEPANAPRSEDTEIETGELDDLDEFEQMVAAGTYQESRTANVNLPRYGMALLMDIPLIDSNPYFFLGDFNIKNDRHNKKKGNKVNKAFFPRLKLFPFTSQDVPIPYETKATLLTEEEAEQETAEEFNIATVESTLRTARRTHRLSAQQFALQVYEAYKEQGFVLFDALAGIEPEVEARRLAEAVISRSLVMQYIPQEPRERLGYTIAPPFMPEIIRYLERFAGDVIKEAARSQSDFERMTEIRKQLLAGARIAQSYCQTTLAKTESLLATNNKKGYDPPNFTHFDAKPPRDLVAMIHLNKQPRDMKALEIAQMTGSAMAAAMPGHQAQFVPQPMAQPAKQFSETDVELIVEERLQEQQKTFDESMRRQEENFNNSLTELRKDFFNQQSRPAADAPAPPEEKSKPEIKPADKPKTK